MGAFLTAITSVCREDDANEEDEVIVTRVRVNTSTFRPITPIALPRSHRPPTPPISYSPIDYRNPPVPSPLSLDASMDEVEI